MSGCGGGKGGDGVSATARTDLVVGVLLAYVRTRRRPPPRPRSARYALVAPQKAFIVMPSALTNKRRELLAAWLSPLAIVPLWAVYLWFGLYPDRSGMFFAFWVMVVIGYPTMFFLALPAWRSANERGGVSWMRLLFYGAVFGSIVPVLLYGFVVCSTILSSSKYLWNGVIREGVEILLIGAAMGVAISAAFKLIASDRKSDPS
jgi:hypothetical protein